MARLTSQRPATRPSSPAAKPADAHLRAAKRPAAPVAKGGARGGQKQPARPFPPDVPLRVVVSSMLLKVDDDERDLLELLAGLVEHFEASASAGARILASGIRGLVVLFTLRSTSKRQGALSTVFTRDTASPRRMAGLMWTSKVEPVVELPAAPRRSVEAPDEGLRRLLDHLGALATVCREQRKPDEGTPLHETLIALEGVHSTAVDFLAAPPGMMRLRGEQASKGKAGGEGQVGALHLELATPLPAAPPQLTSAHLQLIESTSDAFDALGEARETIMAMIADGTHTGADDKTRARVAWLHGLLLTLWGLDGHLCAIAGGLTGVAGSEPASRHAHQLAQLQAFSRQVSEACSRHAIEQAAQAIVADD